MHIYFPVYIYLICYQTLVITFWQFHSKRLVRFDCWTLVLWVILPVSLTNLVCFQKIKNKPTARASVKLLTATNSVNCCLRLRRYRVIASFMELLMQLLFLDLCVTTQGNSYSWLVQIWGDDSLNIYLYHQYQYLDVLKLFTIFMGVQIKSKYLNKLALHLMELILE